MKHPQGPLKPGIFARHIRVLFFPVAAAPKGGHKQSLAPQSLPWTGVSVPRAHTLSRTLGWQGTRHAPEILAVGNQSPSSREEAKAFNCLDGINCYFLLSGWPFELHGTGKAAYEQFLGSFTPSSPCAVLVWPLPKTRRARGGCHWQKLCKGGLLKVLR